ncbi:hypothetical protein O181_036383 [Austropuccinia psidii MF-1]|uniref:Uncharacterized protein n=1 Tax=Austropuccinia psidii MF-1 TaxID=1389203 RepID=A0A9Q3D7C1_9BASI|nr:hypothetical protein [Austropuccinia psidii MF-1]
MLGHGSVNEDDKLLHALWNSFNSDCDPTLNVENLAKPSSSFRLAAHQQISQFNPHPNLLISHDELPLGPTQPYFEQEFEERQSRKRLKSHHPSHSLNMGIDSVEETQVTPLVQNEGFRGKGQLPNPSHLNRPQITYQNDDFFQLLLRMQLLPQGRSSQFFTPGNTSPLSAVSFQHQSQPAIQLEEKKSNENIAEIQKHPEGARSLKIANVNLVLPNTLEKKEEEVPVQNFSFRPTDQEIAWIASLPIKGDAHKMRFHWVNKLVESCKTLNFWSSITGGSTTNCQLFGIKLQLEDFGCRVWDIHTRIIMVLGNINVDNFSRFKHEETNLYKWISGQLHRSDEFTKAKPGGIREPHGGVDWSCFVDALYAPPSKEQQKVWGVSYGGKKATESAVWVVYEKQFDATRAAIQVVGSYFKSTNKTKWKQLFHTDERFIRDFLKDIRRHDTIRAVIRYSDRKQVAVPQSPSAFPWDKDVVTLTTSAEPLLAHYNAKIYRPEKFNDVVFELDPSDRRIKNMFQADNELYDAFLQAQEPYTLFEKDTRS